jgi:hypothetical protein
MEDMLHAVEHSRWKTLLVGAVALATMTGLAATRHHHCHAHQPTVHRLALDAPVRPHAFYLTAWDQGDVTVAFDGDPQPMKITTRALMDDGCHWVATETLTPADATHYAYSYDEEKTSCDPGGDPEMYITTPRTGVVTIY